jgi:hypothetical protein
VKQAWTRWGSLLALFVLLGSLYVPAARAADPANPDGSFNIIVTPQPVSLTAKPGTAVSTDFRIQNQSLATEHVKVSLMKFGAEGEDGTPRLLDFEPGDDEAGWVHFSQTRFDAEPNVWTSVKMTINVPKTAAFGYYFAVLFSRDGAEQQTQPKQANLLGAVAALALLDVEAPGAERDAKIVGFGANRNLYEFLPADFTVRVRNTGNVHVAPRGNIFITKGGKQVATLEVNQGKGFVLPGTHRVFTADWADGWPVYKVQTSGGKVVLDKADKPVRSLSWSNFSPDKLRFGKYKAHLVLVYNDGHSDIPVEATLSFWVVPWRILGFGLLFLLLVCAGLWALVGRPVRARFKKRRASRAGLKPSAQPQEPNEAKEGPDGPSEAK